VAVDHERDVVLGVEGAAVGLQELGPSHQLVGQRGDRDATRVDDGCRGHDRRDEAHVVGGGGFARQHGLRPRDLRRVVELGALEDERGLDLAVAGDVAGPAAVVGDAVLEHRAGRLDAVRPAWPRAIHRSQSS